MTTQSKMIVVWGRKDLLGSSFEFFLSAKKEWKVVNISTKGELDALVMAAEEKQQEIVIIHQGCENGSADFPLQVLQDYPAVKVITITLENNAMEIYSKQKVMVKQGSDLITVIENEIHPDCQEYEGELK